MFITVRVINRKLIKGKSEKITGGEIQESGAHFSPKSSVTNPNKRRKL